MPIVVLLISEKVNHMLTKNQALVLSSSTGGVLAEDYHTHYHKSGGIITAKVLLMESGTTIAHVTSTVTQGQEIAPQSLYQVAKRYLSNPVCVSVGGGNGIGGKTVTRVYSDLES